MSCFRKDNTHISEKVTMHQLTDSILLQWKIDWLDSSGIPLKMSGGKPEGCH